MKLLIVLLAVVALVWLLRGSGRRDRTPPAPSRPAKPAPQETPQPVVACLQCGVHLPRNEALPGRGGVFCSAAHRADYEAAHPQD